MCGLVGVYSSNMNDKHRKVLTDLLFLDTLRGEDSTGVAALRHNADTAILKATVPGTDFINDPRFNSHLKFNDFCWIGHNRFGTIGRNIKNNAHPFEVLDEGGACLLVGAHNGTLKNKHVLTDASDFGTDSEALFNEIAHLGIEEAIAKVEGAWALTYYDHLAEELRFLRNDQRPLCFAFDEKKTTMIWASEAWMIRVACSRRDVKLHEDKVLSVAEDTLYSFPVPLKTNEELTYSKKGGLVGKKPQAFFHGGWTRVGGTTGRTYAPPQQEAATKTEEAASNAQRTKAATESSIETPPEGGETHQSTRSSSSSSAPKQGSNVVPITSVTYKGYGASLLTRKELEDLLSAGCAWCDVEDIRVTDRFAWLTPYDPVCSKCLDGTHGVTHVSKAAFN